MKDVKSMNRKDVTKFLSELLENDRFSGVGKYWSKEVTVDYGKSVLTDTGYESITRRVDYMQFIPENQVSISGLEKGIFICYEIKSCKQDYLSGHGQNFIGEKNYLVTNMTTYKELKESDELDKLPYRVGILVAMPCNKRYKNNRIQEEYDNPTSIENQNVEDWYFETVKRAGKMNRQKSSLELLFCMLRSK